MKQDYIQTRLKDIENKLKEGFSHQTKSMNNLNVYTCGGTTGWRRAVYLDMTDPNSECPSGWQLLSGYQNTYCGRVSNRHYSCDSVFFPINGGYYNQVCGRIRAYQWGLPKAFYLYRYGQSSISSAYFNGVAVMHSNHHIWTFAPGQWENGTSFGWNCPCDNTGNIPVPSFVGEDYFCESGYVYHGYRNHTLELKLHSSDPLWDGKGCHSTSTCCSLHNPPYFTKTLSQSTTDDLQLRMCLFNPISSENIAVELVELYVK